MKLCSANIPLGMLFYNGKQGNGVVVHTGSGAVSGCVCVCAHVCACMPESGVNYVGGWRHLMEQSPWVGPKRKWKGDSK